MTRHAAVLAAALATAACGRRAVGPAPAAPAAPTATAAPAGASLDGARRCEIHRGEAELWAAPCIIAGGQLSSEDGSLAGALAPTDRGVRLDGSFRGGPLAAELFALGDALVGAIVLDGAAAEITVAPPR